jgi:hypothetical protein
MSLQQSAGISQGSLSRLQLVTGGPQNLSEAQRKEQQSLSTSQALSSTVQVTTVVGAGKPQKPSLAHTLLQQSLGPLQGWSSSTQPATGVAQTPPAQTLLQQSSLKVQASPSATQAKRPVLTDAVQPLPLKMVAPRVMKDRARIRDLMVLLRWVATARAAEES